MNRLYSPSVLRNLLKSHGFEFSKALGQNFLIDGNILSKISAGAQIQEGDFVVEVGPGAGTLTEELLLKGAQVVAIEMDRALVPVLEESVASHGQLDIIIGDALKADWGEILEGREGKAKFIANLPYNVGTVIVAQLLEDRVPFKSITVMLQKEVADRMAAQPGTKDYGSLSLLVQYFSQPHMVASVPKTSFMPQPNVESAVIRLDIKEVEKTPWEDTMFKLVSAGFGQRRKTIANSLSSKGDVDKKDLREILKELDIPANLRAENLSLEDFSRIAQEVYKKN